MDRSLRAGRATGRVISFVLATVLAAGLAVFSPPAPALAANGISETASTTYELVPAKGILRVTIDLEVLNQKPSTSTTYFYVNTAYVWIERAARNLKITADRGAVGRTVYRTSTGYLTYKLGIATVLYGQTRRIRVTYDLPGGKPRSYASTRIGRAYASFCVIANGYDHGRVRVIVPSAFDVSVDPGTMASTRVGSRIVYTSGTIADTAAFFRCFEGSNPAGFARETVSSPSGRTVIVEGWPEDKAWRDALRSEVTGSVEALEGLVGSPLPGSGPITVREVTANQLGYYAGVFNDLTDIAQVSENYAQPGLVAHELSHAWFNSRALATRWLSEGLAQWAERASPAPGPACTAPSSYPGTGSPDLDNWAYAGPRATDKELDMVDYDYEAACWIMASLSRDMGQDRMSQVVAALLTRRAAYAESPDAYRPGYGAADWRLFLDLVDERGLVPAGVTDLERAQNLLLQFGVADESALRDRAAARREYHDLLDDPAGWSVPRAIRSPLEAWEFAGALDRIATAREILDLVWAADTSFPGIDAENGPVREQFEDALSDVDINTARDLAEAEANAAEDAAGSLAAVEAALPGTDALTGPVLASFQAATTVADFEAANDLATAEAAAARDVAAAMAAADAALPGTDATRGPAFEQFKAATTAPEFAAAKDLAQAQAAAAKDVADALGRVAAPRDMFQDLGLADVDLGTRAEAARAAVRTADAPAAGAAANNLRATIAGAADVGRGKAVMIAGAVAAGLLVLLVVLLLVIRRRRRARAARLALAVARAVAAPSGGLLDGVAPIVPTVATADLPAVAPMPWAPLPIADASATEPLPSAPPPSTCDPAAAPSWASPPIADPSAPPGWASGLLPRPVAETTAARPEPPPLGAPPIVLPMEAPPTLPRELPPPAPTLPPPAPTLLPPVEAGVSRDD